MIIKNALVFQEDSTFQKGDIFINNEYISENSSDSITIDAKGLYAIPGLTDVHIHGCNGHDFCEGTQESLDVITDYLAKNGVTSFTPASMTLPIEALQKIFENSATYQNNHGALFMGINMEGPFVSSAKKGAQNAAYIYKPDIELFERLYKASNHMIKQVALAPEIEGSEEFIKQLHKKVSISVAHTESDYKTAAKAFELGANHVTHLYNAMPPFTHRAPGVIGAAFDNKNCTVELICDGIHVDGCVVRATFQLFTDDRIILVSDSMMATGLSSGDYELGGQAVHVDGKRATLKSGTIAGSATNLMDCLRQAVSFGIPLESAVKAAAVNPAKFIGKYDKIGSITKGKYANIVLLNKDLEIQNIIIKGQIFTA